MSGVGNRGKWKSDSILRTAGFKPFLCSKEPGSVPGFFSYQLGFISLLAPSQLSFYFFFWTNELHRVGSFETGDDELKKSLGKVVRRRQFLFRGRGGIIPPRLWNKRSLL